MCSLLQEGINIQLQRKLNRRVCERDITFLTARPPFCVNVYCFLRILPPPSQVTYLLKGPIKIHNIPMGSILCCDIMSKRSKICKSFAI